VLPKIKTGAFPRRTAAAALAKEREGALALPDWKLEIIQIFDLMEQGSQPSVIRE